jgi:hypothetical protein
MIHALQHPNNTLSERKTRVNGTHVDCALLVSCCRLMKRAGSRPAANHEMSDWRNWVSARHNVGRNAGVVYESATAEADSSKPRQLRCAIASARLPAKLLRMQRSKDAFTLQHVRFRFMHSVTNQRDLDRPMDSFAVI